MKNVAWTGTRRGRCIKYAPQKILRSLCLVPLPPEAEGAVGCDSTLLAQAEPWEPRPLPASDDTGAR
jgi:hypothetical protein